MTNSNSQKIIDNLQDKFLKKDLAKIENRR